MEFKKWLQNEARFNPSKVTKLTTFGPQQAFNLAIDNEGNVIAGSGMLNGISLKTKMYKEVHSESKMSQNKIIYSSSASPADIAREIRRQEANAKALEAGTELLFNLIFSPKK